MADGTEDLTPAPRGGPRAVARAGLRTATALLAALCFLPIAPAMPEAGLDPGWMLGLNHAIAMRLDFGSDLVFSFGPYAFLYTTLYHPGLEALHLFGATVLLLAYLGALFALAGITRHPLASDAVGVLFTLFLFSFAVPDVRLFAFPLLCLFLGCAGDGPPGRSVRARAVAMGFMGIALALLTLTKGSVAIASAVALGGVLLARLSPARLGLGLLPSLAFLVALPVLWVLSGQNVSSLPGYVLRSLDIIRGYSNAMQRTGQTWHIIMFWLAAAAVILLNRQRLRFAMPSLALLLGTGALLFLSFKSGFVRHDEHALIAAHMLPAVALMFLLAEPVRWRPAAGAVVALVVAGAITVQVVPRTPQMVLARAHAAFGMALPRIVERIRRPEAIRAAYEAALAGIRAAHPLPHVSGTVDIYSAGQATLLAHGMAWSPRPVFQSYAAYTGGLAELNARHLTGPRAPDVVLLSIDPLDDRLASMEDGLSWPALLSGYAAHSLTGGWAGGWAVLHRRPADQERPVTMTPVTRGEFALGEAIPLPAGPVWARVTVRPTLFGRLASIAFRPARIAITLDMPDGRRVIRRLLPDVAPAGFLVSPFVQDTAGFVALHAHEDRFPASAYPNAMRVGVGPGSVTRHFWQDRIAVELLAVALPARADPVWAANTPADTAVRPEPVPAGGPAAAPTALCTLDLVNGIRLSADTLRVAGIVQLDGWGFPTTPDRRLADQVAVLLRDEAGAAHRARAEAVDRPDVAQAFRNAALREAGFHTRIDLRGLAGPYRLDLELTTEGRVETCSLSPEPLQVSP